MDASLWVALSTVTFVVVIYLLAKNAIANFLNEKREEISAALEETKKKRQDAEALYEEYRQKMEGLEQQTSEIIENAEKSAAEMLKKADEDILKLQEIKKAEIARRISEYERSLKDSITKKYADVISNIITDQAKSGGDEVGLDLSELKTAFAQKNI